ncbi:hypothetical protein ACFFUB_09300 [Algimonas porphyrae]|uniref:ATPase n=1 Tax=Algimonas porphyrae TaxID=1128113 RepID=A0ABQ5V2B3_9PROT|nr:hypothetical protein [Algimonas porphyrae]GLQ21690.1 hypothetical protein GCM10007854_26450 [Algimonas porphyrae]
MIFRRIKAHVENENWFAVGIDFFIVVVGVFIGLQVANWNEARILKTEEAAFLMRLHQETVSAEALILGSIGRQNRRFQAFESGLTKLAAEVPDPLTTDECQGLSASAIVSSAVPILPSVEELQQNRGMDLISDAELKRALSSISQAARYIDDLVEKRGRYISDPSQNYPDLMQLRHYIDERGEVRVAATCDHLEMRRNQRFLNAMTMNLDFQDALQQRVVLIESGFSDLRHRLDQLVGETPIAEPPV